MKIKDGSERLKQVRLIEIKVLYLRRHNNKKKIFGDNLNHLSHFNTFSEYIYYQSF